MTTSTNPGHIRNRLQVLGIDLPAVSAAVGSYVPAIVTGNLVYTSGQLPMANGALLMTGSVGPGDEALPVEQACVAARFATLNALAAIEDAIGTLDRISRIVKITVYVASRTGFNDQPAIANHASDLVHRVFGDAGKHARSAVGVAELPLGAPVEVEIIAEIDQVEHRPSGA